MRTVLRMDEVERVTGLSRPTIYRRIREGDFPAQVRLSPGCVGWLDADVEAWLAGRQRGAGPRPVAAAG